ncbi:hypothetical protein D3C80_1356820 [compost metagenome]
MLVRLKALQQFAAHPLRRRFWQYDAKRRLQGDQLIIQLVVIDIIYGRLIKRIILIIVLVNDPNELLHPL